MYLFFLGRGLDWFAVGAEDIPQSAHDYGPLVWNMGKLRAMNNSIFPIRIRNVFLSGVSFSLETFEKN